MKRFLLSVAVAAVGLTLLAANQTQARPASGGAKHSSSGSHYRGHYFKPSKRFDYRRYGYKSFYWNRYRWDSSCNCYCYWAPRYGWCFYEPTYSCYVPVSCYRQVYPEAAPETAPAISPAPSVIQQTTVVTTPPPAVADGPPPPPAPPIVPAPAAVQKTNVGGRLP